MHGDAIDEWRKLRQTFAASSFLARYAHPFLVYQPIVADPSLAFRENTSPRRAMRFNTVRREPPTGATSPPPPPPATEAMRVLPLVKAKGNPFPDRISVGRATNCDLVLRDESVSKLHAHFVVINVTDAELVDIGSANGTFVDGLRLQPDNPARVRSGATIVFGEVTLRMLNPAQFYELL